MTSQSRRHPTVKMSAYEPPAKKPRKGNWTPTEVEVLISEVGKKSNILFSSFSSVITNSMKKSAWEGVASKINSNSSIRRDVADVKKKWTDLKSLTRKKAAAVNRERAMTGGGPPPSDLNAMEQMVVSLIPSCQVEGCVGGMESEYLPQVADEDSNYASVPSPIDNPQPESATSSKQHTVVTNEVEHSTGTSMKKKQHLETARGNYDKILSVEERKLEVMETLLKELLATQKELVSIERRRLEVEEEKLYLLKEHSNLSVPSIIQF